MCDGQAPVSANLIVLWRVFSSRRHFYYTGTKRSSAGAAPLASEPFASEGDCKPASAKRGRGRAALGSFP